MSIYFEKKLGTSFGDVCSDLVWFKNTRLAVSCHSQSDGSYITVFDSLGNVISKVTPVGVDGVVTCIAWHPRGSLAASWGSTLVTWAEGETPTPVESPHRSPVRLILHSQQGGRLISADMEGGLVGWNANGKQLLTAFHHQLSDPITHAVFRVPNTQGLDLRGVAKAAVAGDEQALDMFTNLDMFGWRPKTAGRRPIVYPAEFRDGMAFFAAASSGILLYLGENGRCQEVLDLGCCCRDMLYRPEKDQLLVLTELLAVVHLAVLPEGSVEEIMKVKLSGELREVAPSMEWARPGTVAINLGGVSLRLWSLDTGDNTVLGLPETAPTAEHFTAISYSSSSGVLSGATNAGNVTMWRPSGEDWLPSGSAHFASPVKCLTWGQDMLAVCTLSSLYLLQEHPLSACFRQQVGCVQKTGSTVGLWVGAAHTELSAEMQVRGLAVSSKYCVLFSEKAVLVYQFSVDNKPAIAVQSVGTFQCDCEAAGIYDESLIIMERKRVTMRTVQGTVKQILFLLPTEGEPIIMSSFGHFVAVVTSEGALRLWDTCRREAKSHGQLKPLRSLVEGYGEAMAVCCCSDGSRVAFTVADSSLAPTHRLYVMDAEGDGLFWLDFTTGESVVGEGDGPVQDIRDNMIVSFVWDEEEPKLLVVHTKPIMLTEKSSKESLIVCLWVSPEKGILLHEKIAIAGQQKQLIGCCAPHVTLAVPDSAAGLEQVSLGDFSGVADVASGTKAAVLRFSYHLATGELDLAFQAIHAVTSETVWENLARSCVKSRRLDVAQVCMGRMRNARVARALRQASKEPEPDARVAILAIHLGMLDEAKSLLTGCGRFDLLNRLHQCLGEWEKAVAVSADSDRVRLRTTQHLRARHLEQAGELDAALKLYEASDTHRVHAPRLLADDPARLKAYVDKSGDPVMLKWVAQLLESQGDMQGALSYYTRAQDVCAIVRVLCFLGEFARAGDLATSSGDRAAAYHLARQYEALGRLDEALVFFSKAHAFGNAIRICKEQGTVDKIWSLALQGNAREQADAARFLLEAGDTHRAVLLYQQAGEYREAVELAVSSGDVEALDVISRDLTSQVDPSVLETLAELFVSNHQFPKAVDLLASAGKVSEAVALCTEHSVSLTEELADKLNPTGPDRNKLLVEIGNCALAQGNYHLATKKFTQAGDKVQAMKALLKSGDTDKIIFLAGVSREKEVYVMAANYLQALDWRSDPQLLNTIIQFYSKARAYNALASFYMACANVEVEEYDDLEKALVAMAEARRCIARLPEDATSRRAVETVDRRTAAIQQFVKARRSFASDNAVEATAICRQLMAVNDPDGPVPRGKVLALMLQNEKDRFTARQLYEELRSVVSDPTQYVPVGLLTSLGVSTPAPDLDAGADLTEPKD